VCKLLSGNALLAFEPSTSRVSVTRYCTIVPEKIESSKAAKVRLASRLASLGYEESLWKLRAISHYIVFLKERVELRDFNKNYEVYVKARVEEPPKSLFLSLIRIDALKNFIDDPKAVLRTAMRARSSTSLEGPSKREASLRVEGYCGEPNCPAFLLFISSKEVSLRREVIEFFFSEEEVHGFDEVPLDVMIASQVAKATYGPANKRKMAENSYKKLSEDYGAHALVLLEPPSP
jgi:hypothetical protein